MPLDVRAEERAAWDDGEPLLARIVQSGLRQRAPNATTFQRGWHDGMGEGHYVAAEEVFGKCGVALDDRFPTVLASLLVTFNSNPGIVTSLGTASQRP